MIRRFSLICLMLLGFAQPYPSLAQIEVGVAKRTITPDPLLTGFRRPGNAQPHP